MQLEFIDYSPEYRRDFARLNYEWLEKFFKVEPPDVAVLSDPEGYVLAKGGRIFFARLDGAVVGTCALLNEGEGVYELAKMAVTDAAQGMGIGSKLLAHALDAARGMGARRVRLESSSKLDRALHVYKRAGFKREPKRLDSPYERADIFMTLELT